MCRLLGVVSSETTEFQFSLHGAPRSLAVLSAEHPHGWGIAVHCRDTGWELHKHVSRAGECERFRDVSERARGELLVAHIRKRTVGPVGPHNTHPFQRDGWIFAHNGTIENIDWFTARTSSARAREVQGDTDSERFFAWLLTAMDRAGGQVDEAIRASVDEAVTVPRLGAINFLLSNGRSMWAFRTGRTLHVLERHPGDAVRTTRTSPETDAQLRTPWSPRRHAILLASEHMTDEPWREIEEGTLLRIDQGEPLGERPRLHVLRTPR